jgi:uncharacterized membrane protein YhiD involved in acid resistance
MKSLRSFVFAVVFAGALAAPLAAQQTIDDKRERASEVVDTPDTASQLHQLRHAVVRLPFAAAMACVLAFRARRRGTPKRQPPVIQTQIILAVVGAVVMLVVGSSLARAFGIVGAAGLVRYRAKIEDPKDAGVMLSTLAVGLASGVGIFLLAAFATLFILGLLWVLESFEPRAMQPFTLKISAKDPLKVKPQLERLLTKYRLPFEMRSSGTEEIQYEVRVPVERKTDRLSELILKLDPENATKVEWEEKKDKKL